MYDKFLAFGFIQDQIIWDVKMDMGPDDFGHVKGTMEQSELEQRLRDVLA
jgi:hypothetical protein